MDQRHNILRLSESCVAVIFRRQARFCNVARIAPLVFICFTTLLFIASPQRARIPGSWRAVSSTTRTPIGAVVAGDSQIKSDSLRSSLRDVQPPDAADCTAAKLPIVRFVLHPLLSLSDHARSVIAPVKPLLGRAIDVAAALHVSWDRGKNTPPACFEHLAEGSWSMMSTELSPPGRCNKNASVPGPVHQHYLLSRSPSLKGLPSFPSGGSRLFQHAGLPFVFPFFA